jgi:uncharacterized protein
MKRSRLWYALFAIFVFAVAVNLHALLRLTGLRSFLQGWLFSGLVNLVQVALCFLGVFFAHRVESKRAFKELGVCAPIGRAFIFSFVASLPMLIAFAVTLPGNPKMTVLSISVGSFVAPFAEEVVYRGYAFRQLYRHARCGFWLATLIPSVIFALGHVYQARALWDLVGIMAVTGLGSILFCWIFIRWQDNLWTVVGLHSLMNLWWDVFGVDETALGGWLGNGARLVTVLFAILLTVYKDRIWKIFSTR